MKIKISDLKKHTDGNLWHEAWRVGHSDDGVHLILPDDFGDAKIKGLGDLVALAAQPVAKTIDAILGTDLKKCGGCARRREKLNTAVPFGSL